jgi:hypothetical protein
MSPIHVRATGRSRAEGLCQGVVVSPGSVYGLERRSLYRLWVLPEYGLTPSGPWSFRTDAQPPSFPVKGILRILIFIGFLARMLR